jgi:hypothetical protein
MLRVIAPNKVLSTAFTATSSPSSAALMCGMVPKSVVRPTSEALLQNESYLVTDEKASFQNVLIRSV